jgi:hypothetical protein
MQSPPKDNATLAEGTQHACDMTRTIPDEDIHSKRQYYDDSPVGAIDVIVAIRVLDLVMEAEPLDVVPILRVELSVEMLDESEIQPHVWSIIYRHSPAYLFKGLEEYLKQYCPAPDQVLETLRSFDYGTGVKKLCGF